MTNAQRLREWLKLKSGERPAESEYSILADAEVLRRIKCRESLLVSRERIESILKDLERLEP